MKLLLKDRIVLFGILPTEGNVATMRELKTLKERLSFTEEELTETSLEVTNLDDGNVTYSWNKDYDGWEAEIEITDRAREMIESAFRNLDKQGKITEEILDVYEKFFQEET